MAIGNRAFAASVPLAGVLAGAAVVTRFAAALALALVLAFAAMLGRGTTTMPLAGVLASAAVITRFTSAVALARVHTFAGMLVAACGRLFACSHTANLGAGNNPRHRAEQQFIKTSSFHSHPEISFKESERHH